jgi:5-methylcytosine-specific restriction endonuclease McrA
MYGVVPCWFCGEHVLPSAGTLEHIKALSEGGSSHLKNLAISHDMCNHRRHAAGAIKAASLFESPVQRPGDE